MKTVTNKKKTYGVRGLIEWHTYYAAGRLRLRADFEGGVSTPFGITPARYSTSHPVMQHLIENSPEFKEGKVFLISKE